MADVKSLLGGILSGVIRTAGGVIPGASSLANTLADQIDGGSPEQKAALATALAAHDAQIIVAAQAIITADDEVEKAEASSSDKFTSRARPSLLYLAGLITAALAVGVIFQVKIDTGAVAELLIPLWGHAGFYAYQRTKEKLGGVA